MKRKYTRRQSRFQIAQKDFKKQITKIEESVEKIKDITHNLLGSSDTIFEIRLNRVNYKFMTGFTDQERKEAFELREKFLRQALNIYMEKMVAGEELPEQIFNAIFNAVDPVQFQSHQRETFGIKLTDEEEKRLIGTRNDQGILVKEWKDPLFSEVTKEEKEQMKKMLEEFKEIAKKKKDKKYSLNLRGINV